LSRHLARTWFAVGCAALLAIIAGLAVAPPPGEALAQSATTGTVQGSVEAALRELLGEEVSLTGAGRTDAGVHARAQVANFRAATPMECGRIARGLNALLKDDIAVLGCDDVPESFHSRFDAVARRYSYTISTVPTAPRRDRTSRRSA